jgi:hypothetical protein
MPLTDDDRAALAAMAERADTDHDRAALQRVAGAKDAKLRDLLRGITERTGIR